MSTAYNGKLLQQLRASILGAKLSMTSVKQESYAKTQWLYVLQCASFEEGGRVFGWGKGKRGLRKEELWEKPTILGL